MGLAPLGVKLLLVVGFSSQIGGHPLSTSIGFRWVALGVELIHLSDAVSLTTRSIFVGWVVRSSHSTRPPAFIIEI